MSSLIHADIFFFVSTIALVVIALLMVIALVYLIGILRRTRNVVAQIDDEASLLREDIRKARARIEAEGFKIKHLLSFLFWALGKKVMPRAEKGKKPPKK
ncbi:MAG: hypothetical protein KGJ13_04535 [Patescibacteria group bacterium]|nr:hypothetical protein [Patescibacteria group bacterium]